MLSTNFDKKFVFQLIKMYISSNKMLLMIKENYKERL